ncbi:hypothetical protein ACFORL_09070 [Legionella dresdenensis]|uniref:HTH cro/C1-type domain-containing protein n=1 Tax=Legionella dresdenensis TaxID=450200 RepID=A0ABV8CGF4_9GAMM
MAYRQFSERLNRELDSIGVPLLSQERVEVFAKLLRIPRFKAEAILNGISIPDEKILELLADELEVNPEWLIGKSEVKQRRKKAN